MTRNRTPAIVTWRPSGSTSPKSPATTVDAEHRDPAPGVHVGGGDVVAARDRPVEDVGHVLVDAVDGHERRTRAPARHVLAGGDRHGHRALGRRRPGRAGRRRRGSSRLTVGAAPNSNLPGTTMMMFEPRPSTWSLDLLLRAAADRDQHDDRGDADDDAEHRQRAAQPVGAQRARVRRGTPRRSSSAALAVSHSSSPSRTSMRRDARAATSRSCVTTTTATPRSSTLSRRAGPAPRRRWRCRGCRSARRPAAALGSPTSARAMATRCCSPPDSCDGRWPSRCPRPTASSAAAARSRRSARAHAAVDQRQRDVVQRAGARRAAGRTGRRSRSCGCAASASSASPRRRDVAAADPQRAGRRAGRGSRAGASASTCPTRTGRRRRRTRPGRSACSPRAAPRP